MVKNLTRFDPDAVRAALKVAGRGRRPKEPVAYVNPHIGGIGHLLTSTAPFVQHPHGMARLAPIMSPGVSDKYLAERIHGFPLGPALIMARDSQDSAAELDEVTSWTSKYDHDFEIATPYVYGVTLEDSGVDVEMTAGAQAAHYRFTRPEGGDIDLMIKLRGDGAVSIVSSTVITGGQTVTGPILPELAHATGVTRQYFHAEFSRPLRNVHAIAGPGTSLTAALATASDVIECRVGISHISVDQARRNLERDIPEWNFEATATKLRALWNRTLGKIDVDGGTERQRTIFYTALYRSLLRMTNVTEDGRYYSGYDHQVHQADGHDFYVDDGVWDTYRSMHPLQLLIDSNGQRDMVVSYLRMFEQSGWLPSFPSIAGEQPVMLARHAAAFILDCHVKGLKFDLDLAYRAVRHAATEATMLPWRRGPAGDLDSVYFEKGIFPALAKGEVESDPAVHHFEKRQAVAVTMENAYDDWCVAQLAKALGKDEDYALFMGRARNWANLYNPELGLVAAKDRHGKWVEDFDEKMGGGLGGRDYFAEMNAWTYTFHVQHDPRGLMDLMGGRAAFASKLDALFAEQYGTDKFVFLGQFPDSTGLIGQFAQGNEPSFHIPYLYAYAGEPWKTQKRVRQIMDVWYADQPLGLPGDDDGGAMSSWYVLSAIGFFPVCPGSQVYVLGSPIFEEIRIEVGPEKWFTIRANGVSSQNKYIQSATLNGAPLDKAWFTHDALVDGGSLDFVMGPQPNKAWAVDPHNAPPSMSDQ